MGLILTSAFPVRAETVDLELILAIDVSNSVDDVEATWQRQGYIQAFSNPGVISAILSGAHGKIAVMIVEWAGQSYQKVIVDWIIIDDAETALSISKNLQGEPVTRAPGTSISGLIDFARYQFTHNTYIGTRTVLDISGDGPNSDGRNVRSARDDAVREGIIINGLPILSLQPEPVVNLDGYYYRNVIGGTDSFLFEASMLDDFSLPLVKKMIREIKGPDDPRNQVSQLMTD